MIPVPPIRPSNMSMPKMQARNRNRFASALAFAYVVAASAFAQDKGPIKSVEVVQNNEGYVATVVMFAPVAHTVAWHVLTDFNNMEKWVPNVRESKITSRDGNTLMVEQKGVAKFALLTFPYTSVRKMQLQPQSTIQATQVTGSMRRLVSLMKVTPEGTGTRLDYKLEIEPSGVAATVMDKEYLQREITEQFKAIVAEMVKRK